MSPSLCWACREGVDRPSLIQSFEELLSFYVRGKSFERNHVTYSRSKYKKGQHRDSRCGSLLVKLEPVLSGGYLDPMGQRPRATPVSPSPNEGKAHHHSQSYGAFLFLRQCIGR